MSNLSKEQILSVISMLNIQGKTLNDSFVMLCPYHVEKTPSFSIKLDQGFCKCFGCGKVTSFNNFCKEIFSKSAYELLNLNYNDCEFISMVTQKNNIRQEKVVKKVFNITGEFFKVISNKQVYSYLKDDRRIKSSFIEEFDISFVKKIEINKTEKTNGTFFYNRITIPIYYDNTLVNIEGRDFTYKQKPKVLYPKNTLKPLFNFNNLIKDKPLIIVEGLMDFAVIFQYVDKNCTCIFGNQINELQIELLNKFSELVVIPDNDIAGDVLIKQIENNYSGGDLYIAKLDSLYKDCGLAPIDNIKKSLDNKVLYFAEMIDKIKLFN